MNGCICFKYAKKSVLSPRRAPLFPWFLWIPRILKFLLHISRNMNQSLVKKKDFTDNRMC